MASNSSIVTLKAIMPTVSKFDLRSVTAEVQKELENEAKYLEKQFKKTTRTWKHKPRFESITAVTGQSMELLVGTDDVIYGWVNNGTKKHPITPRNKSGLLRFRKDGYKPKTRVGVVNSFAGRKAKPPLYSFKQVTHPGIKPRNFAANYCQTTRKNICPQDKQCR
jgi:hypothetical protein